MGKRAQLKRNSTAIHPNLLKLCPYSCLFCHKKQNTAIFSCFIYILLGEMDEAPRSSLSLSECMTHCQTSVDTRGEEGGEKEEGRTGGIFPL